ncbi:WD40 repeat-like protein [Hysterangium stoloniferum]|nr:WD40 repeat-like protein [Hysterangium stoloniferum]
MDAYHFAFRIPKAIQTSLAASAFFARFDNSGHYIATSRSDFIAVIWDLDTMSEVRILEGHVLKITDISWSRCSRYVLTASADWNCIVWDLVSVLNSPQRLRTIRFDVPVLRASFHPRNSNIVLALLETGEAFVVDSRPGYPYRTELCEIVYESDENSAEASGRTRAPMTCIEFGPTGKLIFAGTSQGYVLVFSTRTKRMIARHRVNNAGSIRHLKLSRCGRFLLTNSTDRVIRHFEIPAYPPPSADSEAASEYVEQDIEPVYKFADPVDKVQWNGIGYSADTEWVIGGAADAAKHKIYVWDLSQEGILYETLEGGREPLVDIQWHPTKAAMASTTKNGTIFLWHCPTLEKWSAFAGDFEELDENVEYIEKEDEFDIEDEEDIIARKMRAEEDDVDVDGSDDDRFVLDPYIETNEKGWEEDIRWAEACPDDDSPNWTMRIIMRDDM